MTIILHISDIHCRNEKLKNVLETENYDIAVATGDFECVETAKTFIEKSKGEALAITGNLDHPGVARLLRSAGVLIDGRIVEIMGIRFVGIGGMDFIGSLNMVKTLLPLEGVHVLLSHHPPRRILDRTFIGLHAGLKELWDVINHIKPHFHLFGHIHESPGITESNGVVFVNPGPLARGRYAIIDFKNRKVYLKKI